MGWSVGENAEHRDVGYGVPATCDWPGCGRSIDRGVAYACGGMHDGAKHGCGRYFCLDAPGAHLSLVPVRSADGLVLLCPRCVAGEEPVEPTPDVPTWVEHKLTHGSWRQWREEHPEWVREHSEAGA